MELSKAYKEMNKLLAETNEQRRKFSDAASRVSGEMEVVEDILRSFAYEFPYQRNREIYVTDDGKSRRSDCIDTQPFNSFGEVVLQFNKRERPLIYSVLTKITEQELERDINFFSPEELEIIKMTSTAEAVAVRVKLKGIE